MNKLSIFVKHGSKISLFTIVALAVVVVFLLQSQASIKRVNYDNIKALQDSIRTTHDKYGRVVAEKRAFQIEKNQLKHLNDSLKTVIKGYKPEIVVKWKTKTVYKNKIHIKYDTSFIDCKFSFPFKWNDEWVSMKGISSDLGLTFNEIIFINKQSLVFGYTRDGFLKPSYLSVKIVNSNPNMQVQGLESYKIKKNKGLFSKWYFWGAVGLVTGKFILQ